MSRTAAALLVTVLCSPALYAAGARASRGEITFVMIDLAAPTAGLIDAFRVRAVMR